MSHDAPFFCIQDTAYDRILAKLRNGSSHEWSFAGICPHRNKASCRCERFKNVLDPTDSAKLVRIVDGVAKPVIRASELLQRPEVRLEERCVNVYTEHFATRPDYGQYLKGLTMDVADQFPLKVNIFFQSGETKCVKVNSYERYCFLIDNAERLLISDYEDDHRTAAWNSLLDKIVAKTGMNVVVKVERSGDDVDRHMASIRAVVKKCRKNKRLNDTMVANGTGPVMHAFPGSAEEEAADLLAIPKYDVTFFIATDGRVDAVGARAVELRALLEM